jgi:hypothetical protein
MTYTQDKKTGISPCSLRLCQFVAGKSVETLWNNDWLKTELISDIPYDKVVDGRYIEESNPSDYV